jgi:hypothetical protein
MTIAECFGSSAHDLIPNHSDPPRVGLSSSIVLALHLAGRS